MSLPFEPENIISISQPALRADKFNIFFTNYDKPTCILSVGDYDSFRHFQRCRFRKAHIGVKRSGGYFLRAYKVKHYFKYYQKNGKVLTCGYFRCKESCEESDCFIVIDIDNAFKIDKDGEIVSGNIPPINVVSLILTEMKLNHFGHSSHNFDEANQKSHFMIQSQVSATLLAVNTQWLVVEINKRLAEKGFDFITLSIESLEPSRAFYFPTIPEENAPYKVVSYFDGDAMKTKTMLDYHRMEKVGNLRLLGLSSLLQTHHSSNSPDGEKQPQSHCSEVVTVTGTSIPDCYAHLKSGADGAHPYCYNMAKYFNRIDKDYSYFLSEVSRVLIEGNNPLYVSDGEVLPDRISDIESIWESVTR